MIYLLNRHPAIRQHFSAYQRKYKRSIVQAICVVELDSIICISFTHKCELRYGVENGFFEAMTGDCRIVGEPNRIIQLVTT